MLILLHLFFFGAQISLCKCSNLLNFRPTRPERSFLAFSPYLNHMQNFSNLKKDRERFGFLR